MEDYALDCEVEERKHRCPQCGNPKGYCPHTRGESRA
jgi:hypothetical protein